jgi:glutathione gamma-glutamylcysteinyltransferase
MSEDRGDAACSIEPAPRGAEAGSSQTGFYRRPLPQGLIPFSSAEGRQVFREALLEGGMEGYFSIAEQLHTQAEPAFCGLGTLVVVLNALSIDPGRLWKGPWRWFGEELLDCCRPLDTVKREGITMSQFACLARCNGARVRSYPAEASTISELRYHVRAASSAPGGVHVVAAYSRKALGQSGDGHYSPIGGYHRGRDLALILDVARFKYPPHWAPLPVVWEAMQPEDPATQRPRGYFVLSRADERPPICCALEDPGSWARLEELVIEAFRELLADGSPPSLAALVGKLAVRIPENVLPVLAPTAPGALGGGSREREALDLFEEVRATRMFELVRGAAGISGRSVELAAILLLSLPRELSAALPESVSAELEAMRSPEALSPRVHAEVLRVRAQLTAIDDYCQGRV